MRSLAFAAAILVAASTLATNSPVNAQQVVKRVGVLINGGPGSVIEMLKKQFAGLGYVEGDNVVFEPRFAEGKLDRLPTLAADLAASGVAVMLTLGGPASRAAADATKTVPVVFSIVTDPVALKLVASAERPGGNVTGITSLDPQQAAAQLSLFKEVLPNLKTVAILSDKTIPGADASGMAPIDRANEAAANALGLRAQIIKLDNPPNLAAAFDAMVSENAGAVLVLETPIPFAHMRAIAEMAASRRVPAMLPGGQAAAGGLLVYGTSVADTWPRLPVIADKILKGANAGDLPVEIMSRRELIINAKLARELGIIIPASVAQRASRILD
jgi:putative ABC transport system substrate-binding protein